MSWGESIANQVLKGGDTVIHKEEVDTFSEERGLDARMNIRHYLGISLQTEDEIGRVLVFIRFGGPPYQPEQIHFAHLVAEHVEQLLVRQHLMERVAALEAEKRLIQLQEDFLSAVSHELRSPLGFIKGYATSLLRQDTQWDQETRREFLRIIDSEADRLTEIIDKLLDSSRLQAGILPMDIEAVRLSTLLDDFVHRMQAGNFDIEIQKDVEACSDTVWVDPARIVEVFDNIVNNAVKYAPKSVVLVSLDWEPERAHVAISDTGPGIPAEELENIFKRFYRLPEHRAEAKGTGLGLYICREIVRAHGGEMFAESQLGDGTTFHVYLPRERSFDEPAREEMESLR